MRIFDGSNPILRKEISDQATGMTQFAGLSGTIPVSSLQPIVARESSLLITFDADDTNNANGTRRSPLFCQRFA